MLADLRTDERRAGEAQAMLHRALALRERAFGVGHEMTANALDELAQHHRRRGAVEEALPLWRRALAIREKVLGVEHPTTVRTRNDLAALGAGGR
jgi:hypothetical protein